MQQDQVVAMVIPAYEPDEKIIHLIEQCEDVWFGPIMIVDDGSGAAYAPIFEQLEELGCDVVHHQTNGGKGKALRTGFAECLKRWPFLVGVITADADGQHAISDICKCRDALLAHPDCLVMGCRDFSDANIPRHNRYGNQITRVVMRLLCGISVSDTQTGLRGISRAFLQELVHVDGDRYEYEMNMLTAAQQRKIPIYEVKIAAIYIDDNATSHFHVVRDSIRIYGQILKFAASSLAGFVVDIVMFALLLRLLQAGGVGVAAISIATVLARICSAFVNYIINRKIVFKSRKQTGESVVKYGILSIAIMISSAALVTALDFILPISTVVTKIIVDFLLFFVSYRVQRLWVF